MITGRRSLSIVEKAIVELQATNIGKLTIITIGQYVLGTFYKSL